MGVRARTSDRRSRRWRALLGRRMLEGELALTARRRGIRRERVAMQEPSGKNRAQVSLACSDSPGTRPMRAWLSEAEQ